MLKNYLVKILFVVFLNIFSYQIIYANTNFITNINITSNYRFTTEQLHNIFYKVKNYDRITVKLITKDKIINEQKKIITDYSNKINIYKKIQKENTPNWFIKIWNEYKFWIGFFTGIVAGITIEKNT